MCAATERGLKEEKNAGAKEAIASTAASFECQNLEALVPKNMHLRSAEPERPNQEENIRYRPIAEKYEHDPIQHHGTQDTSQYDYFLAHEQNG